MGSRILVIVNDGVRKDETSANGVKFCMSGRNILRKIPWKIALPGIVLIITMFLLHLDKIWLQKTRGVDQMYGTSAWGLVCLLIWPGLFLSFWLRYLPAIISGFYVYDWGRLGAGLLFWACIGWLLDRRLAGVVRPVVPSRWIRISLYTLGFAVAIYALVLGGLGVVRMIPFVFPQLVSRWIYLMGPELNLAAAVWGLIGACYFGSKLLRSAAEHRTVTT
jgi:hypothetical protein